MRNPGGNVPWRARGAARAMGTTVAAWPKLPEAIKVGIVAMVKAALSYWLSSPSSPS